MRSLGARSRVALPLLLAALLACEEPTGRDALHSPTIIETRPFQLRLSTDRRYRPCPQTYANTPRPAWRCEGPSESIAKSVRRRLDRDHVRALRRLLAADSPDTIKEVVRSFERLRTRKPSGNLLNDLAVAYTARAALHQRPSDRIRAWQASLEAKHLEPDAGASAFNEAMLSIDLGLRPRAEDALKVLRVAELDGDWAGEIERRLEHGQPGTATEESLLDVLEQAIKDLVKVGPGLARGGQTPAPRLASPRRHVRPRCDSKPLATATSKTSSPSSNHDRRTAKPLAGIP